MASVMTESKWGINVKWEGISSPQDFPLEKREILESNLKAWDALTSRQRRTVLNNQKVDFSRTLDLVVSISEADRNDNTEEARKIAFAKETIARLFKEVCYLKTLGNKPVKALSFTQKVEINRIITTHPKFRTLMDGDLATPLKRAFIPNECWNDLRQICPTLAVCSFKATKHQQRWADANTVTIRGVFSDVTLFNGARPLESIVQEKISSLETEIKSIKNKFVSNAFD
jgi:hypothetical protein